MKPCNFPGRKLVRRVAALRRAGVQGLPSTSGIIKDIRYRCGRKRRSNDGRPQ